jgi:hypothetical protein
LTLNEVVTRDRQILNLFDALLAQTDRLDTHDNRIGGTEGRIDGVESRMGTIELLVDREVYLTPRQAVKFRNSIKTRVRELLPHENDYKSFSKKYFSALYSEIYSRFAIGEYRELPRKEFEAALLIMKDWEPTTFICH